MQPGMQENRLVDGNCICDALVEAPPEKIVAAFGQPVKLAENGRALADESIATTITLFAAAWKGMKWSVVEAVSTDEEPPDYIVTLLRQAGAALKGDVLQLPPSYENGLGVAQRLAKALGVRGVAVWGSDEWIGLGGGAIVDGSGKVVRACNVCEPEDIAKHLASRERLIAGEDDEDEAVEEYDDIIVEFEPGSGLRTFPGEIIPFLDRWFKELGAAQPFAPPSLWGEWGDYESVWGATPAAEQ